MTLFVNLVIFACCSGVFIAAYVNDLRVGWACLFCITFFRNCTKSQEFFYIKTIWRKNISHDEDEVLRKLLQGILLKHSAVSSTKWIVSKSSNKGWKCSGFLLWFFTSSNLATKSPVLIIFIKLYSNYRVATYFYMIKWWNYRINVLYIFCQWNFIVLLKSLLV